MNNKTRLMLGTAQLGGNYGIANAEANLTVQSSRQLINYAVSAGIGYLDTAPGYGDSETIIGGCLGDFNPKTRPAVVTKLPSVQRLGLKTEEERRSFVYSSVMSSLDRLKLAALDVCLLHDPLDMSAYKGGIIEILNELKQKQMIRRIGVSVYDPQEVETFLSLEGVDSIQIPVNLFDQRLIRNGMLNRLSEKGTEIFARSVYLQGLLLMDPEKLPDKLKQAEAPLNLLLKYCEDTGISIKELCFLFVRDLPGLTGIVVGCETVEQLEENLKWMSLPPLKQKIMKEAGGLFAELSLQIIDPRRWK